MKKIILLLFLLLLLVLGVVVVFIYHQKTSAWKTYIDPTFGYSLQYPTSWQIETVGENNHIRISNLDKHKGGIGVFEVDPSNKLGITLPIETWLEKQDRPKKGEPWGGAGPLELIEKVIIDGKAAPKVYRYYPDYPFDDLLDNGGYHLIYFVPDKANIYTLTLQTNSDSENFDNDGSELAKIYQTMLNSFKLPK